MDFLLQGKETFLKCAFVIFLSSGAKGEAGLNVMPLFSELREILKL